MGRIAARLRGLDPDRLGIAAFGVVMAVFVGLRFLGVYPWDGRVGDLFAYWGTRDGLDYATAHPGATGAYLYSPAFAQLIAPLVSFPWPVFAAAWTALIAVPLIWVGGRYAVLLAILPPIGMSIALGQLDLAFAAVVVAGFRWPVVWALPIVTKITPGIGLVWFLVRREWRSLGLAMAATLGVVALSAALDPEGWVDWLRMLRRLEFPALGGGLVFLPVPLWLRVPVAVALVAWGAATDRRWTVPVGVCLALPTVWLNSPTILVAILPLVAAGARTPAAAWQHGSVSGTSLSTARRRLARWWREEAA